jgi:hypothetical protein
MKTVARAAELTAPTGGGSGELLGGWVFMLSNQSQQKPELYITTPMVKCNAKNNASLEKKVYRKKP